MRIINHQEELNRVDMKKRSSSESHKKKKKRISGYSERGREKEKNIKEQGTIDVFPDTKPSKLYQISSI